jgi:hypothetical protein
MGKAAFVLGIVGSLIAGILLSSRLDHRDYSGSIVNKQGGHATCPTFWMTWDKAPDLVPEGFVQCACSEQAVVETNAQPVHPPKEVHDAAAAMDVLTVSYTTFTSPRGTKSVGLSYVLARGADRQTFVISPSFGPYSGYALWTAMPFLAGIVLGIVLGLIPKKGG